uniref:NADH-ubiquinone oxidoreductase chain 6 n=1 Tax=Bicellonychia lividipennis TaxID=1176499 RepID=A0A158V195_9COLE|nr:NADH dehydrogenase subunit 6 [Bicellonychia lividipennis]AIQ80145.1 NADH dehydrogenase subunit 6 [Bicellonychia lividipennis]
MEMIMSLMMTSTIMFMFTNHPLSMGLMLLIQTTLISLASGFVNLNFWFSYILFIVMVGGLLVLFIYMTSIASNEKFKHSNMMMFILMMTLLVIAITMILYNPYDSQYSYSSIDSMPLDNQPLFFMTLSKYMSYPMSMISIMLIIYLLIALIAVVKITMIKYGPLRQKF